MKSVFASFKTGSKLSANFTFV